MKIFGVSFVTLVLLFAAFYLGAKNPGVIAKFPGMGK